MLATALVSPPYSHYTWEVYDIDSLPRLSVNTAIDVGLLLHLFVRCCNFNEYSSVVLSFYRYFTKSKCAYGY